MQTDSNFKQQAVGIATATTRKAGRTHKITVTNIKKNSVIMIEQVLSYLSLWAILRVSEQIMRWLMAIVLWCVRNCEYRIRPVSLKDLFMFNSGLASRSRESESWESRCFLGSRSQSRKNMLNSDSQFFAGMEGFLCHEQITKVYCWSK